VESGGKDKVIPFMSLLTKLGLKTWGLLDLDFIWRGAGGVFKSDADYSTFCNKLNTIAPITSAPKTDAEKRDEKRKRMQACTGDLKEDVHRLAERLVEHQLYVLRCGEIESYFGMGEQGKGQYMKAATDVLSGERHVDPTDEFERLFNDLEAWSVAKQN
jgi:hypothetical protein